MSFSYIYNIQFRIHLFQGDTNYLYQLSRIAWVQAQ